MIPSGENDLSLYWDLERPEYRHAWQLCFEQETNRRPLLVQVLQHLPAELGSCEFVEEHPSHRFVLLVTYDENNEGARRNAFHIFFILATTDAVRFIGAEGAWGLIDLEGISARPDVKLQITQLMLSKRQIAPHEAAAIAVEQEVNPVIIWGIEDKALYQETLTKYRARAPDYYKLLAKREEVLLNNLLSEQEKRGIDITVGSLTEANYSAAHRLLYKKRIAHAGIRATASGKEHPGLLSKVDGEAEIDYDDFILNLSALGNPQGAPVQGFPGFYRTLVEAQRGSLPYPIQPKRSILRRIIRWRNK